MNLKKISSIILCTLLYVSNTYSQSIRISPDIEKTFQEVEALAYKILATGFNAGDGYNQVWARDLNTFIKYSCKVLPQDTVKEALLKFFYFQGFDGNMIDGYEEVRPGYVGDNYSVYVRYDMPGYVFHKNTVETDQETSLIQAVYKYIVETGDTDFINIEVNGLTVYERMELMLLYLMKHRFNEKYGLIWGATTIDWGDVQALHPWGVKFDEQSIPSIDIYDNAMMLIALDNFLDLSTDPIKKEKWLNTYSRIRFNTKEYLWDENNNKFIPHLYIRAVEFEDIDESKIYYHGGTIVAIEAGLLSLKEIKLSLEKMRDNMQKSGAQSIGLTVYPAYPDGSIQNSGLGAYQYQNGGDWTWFGARIIPQLVKYGLGKDAIDELLPFTERVVENNGFYEWYTIDGLPKGSGIFRGSAGVLLEAIEAVRSLNEK